MLLQYKLYNKHEYGRVIRGTIQWHGMRVNILHWGNTFTSAIGGPNGCHRTNIRARLSLPVLGGLGVEGFPRHPFPSVVDAGSLSSTWLAMAMV